MIASAWGHRPEKLSNNALPIMACSGVTHLKNLPPVSSLDVYQLTSELLGEGAYAKVQGAVSLQSGKEYAVKVSVPLGPHINFANHHS